MKAERAQILMDHRSLDAEVVAERYVTGRLPPEEAARFEEHYLDCPECCLRIETARRLQRGLARLAADAARPPAARFRPTPAWGLAAAALLAIALLPAVWGLREVKRLRADLEASRATLAQTRAERPAADRPAARPAVREAELRAELEKARGDLAAIEERRAALAREVAAGRKPLWNVPILALTPLRDGAGEGPVRTLTLPREPGWVALWIEPGGVEHPAYRVVLTDSRGTAVFSVKRLAENDLGALFVALHSTTLSPGSYRLAVDGIGGPGGDDGDGPATPVARFPLRVVSPE